MERSKEIQGDTERCREIWRDIQIQRYIEIYRDIERYRKIQSHKERSRDIEI